MDQTNLTGIFINYKRKAKWNDDIIFLYSHGNGAWVGALFESSQIEFLSKFGSIFVYDYRQYGLSEGVINEHGTYSDILGAWNYLTQIKKINPNKIVLYGHSMGGAVTTYLLASLLKANKTLPELPRAMIIEGTFSSIVDMADHIFPGLGKICIYDYDNIKNLQYINNIIPILVMHSPSDETIPYYQSLKIKKKCKCSHIAIDGTHSVPIFNNDVINFIKNITT